MPYSFPTRGRIREADTQYLLRLWRNTLTLASTSASQRACRFSYSRLFAAILFVSGRFLARLCFGTAFASHLAGRTVADSSWKSNQPGKELRGHEKTI